MMGLDRTSDGHRLTESEGWRRRSLFATFAPAQGCHFTYNRTYVTPSNTRIPKHISSTMPSFTSAIILTVIDRAFDIESFVVAQPFALLTAGAIRTMSKAELQSQLRIRGLNVSGSVKVLRARVKARVEREKRGEAERPKVDLFTLTKAKLRVVLEAHGCTVSAQMRRAEMLERLITAIEEARRGALRRAADSRRREKRARGEEEVVVEEQQQQGRPTKRQRTDGPRRRNKRVKAEGDGGRAAKRVKTEVGAVDVVSVLVKPVEVTAKVTFATLVTGGKAAAKVAKGAKKAVKVARRAKLAVQDRKRGFDQYRKEGGRDAYQAKVKAEADRLQMVHKNYGKNTFLGVSSFFGLGFGPRGLSRAKAIRLARQAETSRLRRPESDDTIKGYFGRDDEVERRIKEATWNSINANNLTPPGAKVERVAGTSFFRPISRRAENPFAKTCPRSRTQVKFNLKPCGPAYGVPGRAVVAKSILKNKR